MADIYEPISKGGRRKFEDMGGHHAEVFATVDVQSASVGDIYERITKGGRRRFQDMGNYHAEVVAVEGSAGSSNVLQFIPPELHAEILAGTSTADVSSYLKMWLETAASEGKEAIGVPGRFSIDDQVQINLDSSRPHVRVRAPTSFVIASSALVDTPLLSFVDATGSGRYSLSWEGGTINNSLGVWVDNTQSNTGIELIRLIDVSISGTVFQGNNNIVTETFTSDAGVTAVDTENLRVENCIFDKVQTGLYTSGTGGASSRGKHSVIGCTFRNSQRAMQAKGEIRAVDFSHNFCHDILGNGFLTIEVADDYPGREAVVIGNVFERVAQPVQLRGPGPGSVVAGNIIRDFGFKPGGTVSDGTQQAIRLLGIADTQVIGNTILMDGWTTSANHVAIFLSAFTLTGVAVPGPRAAERNSVYCNVINAVAGGIFEGVTAPVGVNRIAFNTISGATTPYTVSSLRMDLQDTGLAFEKASSTSLSTVGVGINKDGWIIATRNGSAALLASRTGSYGAVAQFYRDATALGRIDVAADSIGLSAAVTNGHVLLSPNGTGCVVVPIASVDPYADDAAAAAGGVPVGGIYRTASALKIRAA